MHGVRATSTLAVVGSGQTMVLGESLTLKPNIPSKTHYKRLRHESLHSSTTVGKIDHSETKSFSFFFLKRYLLRRNGEDIQVGR